MCIVVLAYLGYFLIHVWSVYEKGAVQELYLREVDELKGHIKLRLSTLEDNLSSGLDQNINELDIKKLFSTEL